MKVGELFVSLGVKGGSQLGKTLGSVQKGLGKVATSGLQTKAAIAGVIYGLQALTRKSNTLGKDLVQFSKLTGLSAESLQRWQYAGKQAGASFEEVKASIVGVQSAIASYRLGQSVPLGMSQLVELTGFDVSKAEDTFYVLQKLQELSQKARPEIARNLVGSFGVSQSMIAAMIENAFNKDVMSQAPVITNQQAGVLRKMYAQWANFFQRLEILVAKVNVKIGPHVINGLQKIVTQFAKFVIEFSKLAENLRVFEIIAKSIEGWTMIFSGVNKMYKWNTKKEDEIKSFLSERELQGKSSLYIGEKGGIQSKSIDNLSSQISDFIKGLFKSNNIPIQKEFLKDKSSMIFNQNFNFNSDGSNAKEVGREVKNVSQSFYASPQAQVT